VQRLVCSTSDDFERSLLRSARSEGPSPEAVRKAVAVLTGTAVVTTAGTAAAAGGATLAGKAAASGAVAKGLLALVAPWVAVGVVTSGALIGVATVVVHQRDPESHAPAVSVSTVRGSSPGAPARSSASVSQPAAVASAPETIEELAARATPVSAEPSASVATTASGTASPTSKASVSAVPSASSASESRGSVTEQVKAMDRARQALASGKALEALLLLDQFSRDFPRSALSLEAEVLKIEACAAGGRRARAIYLAERFLASHPHDTHAPRVRGVLDALSNR